MTFPHKLGAIIMHKNESATILITLKSVLGCVDCVVCFDTGSTDDTVEVVQRFCKQHKMPLYVIHGAFVDFSTSRNVLLEFAEHHCEYQLHLDSADVLLGGDRLRQFVRNYRGPASAFMLFQQWFMGRSSIRFRNLRLCKSRCGYRYRGRVHEMLIKPDFNPDVDTAGIDTLFDERPEVANDPNGSAPLTGFVVFQNRTLDNTKTLQRFQRDAVMLYEDWKADPNDVRTLFYLGQTYDHMGDPQRGYLWYQKRVDRAMQGFTEETLHALMRLGKLATRMGMDDEVAETYYWRSINFSMKYWGRTLLEPVMLLVGLMDSRREFGKAYHLLTSIMSEPYPVTMNLFVDASAYKYTRYHWMGRVAWYVSQFAVGGWYSVVAYRVNRDDTDMKNLRLYLSISPHEPKKWEDQELLNRLVRSCPSQEAFERAWSLGEMSFPDVEIGPPDVVNTSAEGKPAVKQAAESQAVGQTGPVQLASLSSKQKMEVKRQQQRLMRKAK